MTYALREQWSDFSVAEWHRLISLADKFEPKMRLAFTRATRDGKTINKLELRKTIIDILCEVCATSAEVYGLVFNPNSPIYIETIDRLVNHYASLVDSSAARDAVKAILPQGISLAERRERLDTFGLDARSAVSLERYRQERGTSPSAIRDVARAKAASIRERGNLLALTETNRAVNQSLEALWIDNQQISKADDVVYLDATIPSLGKVPKTARKEWVTRRDGRVCRFCDPLDGLRARLGQDFETDIGYLATPPAHPRCRCFIIITAR